MNLDIVRYSARIGMHDRPALKVKCLKYFCSFEILIYIGMFLYKSRDRPRSDQYIFWSHGRYKYRHRQSNIEFEYGITTILINSFFSLAHYNEQTCTKC